MRVLITGGTGNVGRAATERLIRSGWHVRVVGRREGVEIPGAEYAACDITRFDDVCDKMAGCDVVVHLAAIASPGSAPGSELMRVNVLGTFNVFEAAAKSGVRRIVQASSINAFGCWWGLVDLNHVQYFPIDEEHPTFTTDVYSFSKEVIERVGDYYWRRDGISSVALRLPGVYPAGRASGEAYVASIRKSHAFLDEMCAMPAAKRLEHLAAARRTAAEFRRLRPLEYGGEQARKSFDDSDGGPLYAMYNHGGFNFWASLDERDSAQAIEKSLLADCEGSNTLFVNDSHNSLLYDTEKLLGLFFPQVTDRKRAITDAESLVSIDKARGLIGFEPEHSMSLALKGGA
ncbi:MAG: NAD(P)-dependent oxidoreductase [Planctomycetes bacterium]|nr:NAD(P)-dependent oxidoreductase [Planctomycetota bacterium]